MVTRGEREAALDGAPAATVSKPEVRTPSEADGGIALAELAPGKMPEGLAVVGGAW